MADITEKLTSVLSDSDGLKRVGELADMVKDIADANTYSNVGQNNTHSNDIGATAGNNGFNETSETSDTADTSETADFDTSAFDDLFGGIDLSQILELVGMLTTPKEDKNVNFLNALKPLLSEERAPKVEKAVRVIKMMDIYIVLKDSGMLSGLAGII